MITPEMLRALQTGGGIAVIDVRESKDFSGETGHVPGSINLPLGDLPARIAELEAWRKDGVVLICRTQVRSGQAARLLAKQGFSGLRVVRGGILAWRELGYPTEGNALANITLGHQHA
jgi:rhodanese-related sulfurtransferase